MPKVIALSEIAAILESGSFDQLIGSVENEHVECKSAPYQLDQLSEKMEFAKDVSALANAGGGVILIGIQTERDPAHQGETIRRVRCFAESLVELSRYQNVIEDWIIPQIPGVKLAWHRSAQDSGKGIVSIFVPPEASKEKPFLVSRVVESSANVIGSYVGFFERTRDRVAPTKPEQLRRTLKDGQRFSELDTRLANIEEMIGKVAAELKRREEIAGKGAAERVPEKPAFARDAILRRIQRARKALGYEGKPTFSLASWPLEQIEFANLFELRDVPVVRLLENPPEIRDNGFDLDTGRSSSIIDAQLRRCWVSEYKVLEVWRDGILIFVTPGDDQRLCWAMNSTPDTGLRINNLALTEMVYLFCDWMLKTYKYANPLPVKLKVNLGLSDMFVESKPFSLSPYRPNKLNLGDRMISAPGAFFHNEVEIDFQAADAGLVAYRLLADLYAWFGFNTHEMPYLSINGSEAKIDPAQIF
jgi:hypothetical protein